MIDLRGGAAGGVFLPLMNARKQQRIHSLVARRSRRSRPGSRRGSDRPPTVQHVQNAIDIGGLLPAR